MAQVSASIKPDLIKQIKNIQKKDKQESFSQTIEMLLQEAVANRKSFRHPDLIKQINNIQK